MLTLLKAEQLKLKRSPIWIIFFIVPIIPALLGTVNYLANLELLKSEWESLWTQHTLFTCYFFLPIVVSTYCSYLMYLEYTNRNWNKVLTLPISRAMIFTSKVLMAAIMIFFSELWIALLFIISGLCVGLTNPPLFDIFRMCLFGMLGGTVMAALQLMLSLFIKNFAPPIAIGFVGGLSGFVFTSKGYGHIWPYSLMSYGMNANNNIQQLGPSDYLSFIIVCLIYLILFTFIGSQLIKKREL